MITVTPATLTLILFLLILLIEGIIGYISDAEPGESGTFLTIVALTLLLTAIVPSITMKKQAAPNSSIKTIKTTRIANIKRAHGKIYYEDPKTKNLTVLPTDNTTIHYVKKSDNEDVIMHKTVKKIKHNTMRINQGKIAGPNTVTHYDLYLHK